MKIKTLRFITYMATLFFSSENILAATMLQEKLADTLVYDRSKIVPKTFSNLTEKYNGNDFNYAITEASTGWWTRFKNWLSELFFKLLDLQDQGKASQFTEYMINTAIVIICVLVIYFIFKAIVNKEGKWVFGKSSDTSIIPITSVEQELKHTNFEKLITSAETDNNYRLAIRYYYLWLLKSLNEAKIIDYDPDKTNSDYQYEIKTERLQKSFAYTSYLYNYIWYGEFNVNETQFTKAKNAFTSLLNSIK